MRGSRTLTPDPTRAVSRPVRRSLRAHERSPVRPRGRRRLRDRDRRAGQGGRRAALSRRRHRGPRRPRAVRAGLGPAGRRHARARACRRPSRIRSRSAPATRASTCRPRSRMLGPEWGFRALIDIDDAQARDDLARASVMALSFVAQSARGAGRPPVPQREIDKATSIPERFLIRWRGEADPDARQGDRRLLDLRRRARHERVDVHRPRRRLDRRGRRRRAVGRRRRALGPAARRRAGARAEDARRRRARGRRRALRQGRCSTAASG